MTPRRLRSDQPEGAEVAVVPQASRREDRRLSEYNPRHRSRERRCRPRDETAFARGGSDAAQVKCGRRDRRGGWRRVARRSTVDCASQSVIPVMLV